MASSTQLFVSFVKSFVSFVVKKNILNNIQRLILSIFIVFASGFIAGSRPLTFLVAACAVCVARWSAYLYRPFTQRRYFILDPQTPDAKSLADLFSKLIEETRHTHKTIILRLATFTTDPRFRPRLSLTHDNDIELSNPHHKKHALHCQGIWLADHPLPFDIPLTRSLTLIFSPCAGSRVRVAEDTPPAIPIYARVGGVLLIALACRYNLNTLLAALLGFIGETYLMRR
jgi:hypothetical protein